MEKSSRLPKTSNLLQTPSSPNSPTKPIVVQSGFKAIVPRRQSESTKFNLNARISIGPHRASEASTAGQAASTSTQRADDNSNSLPSPELESPNNEPVLHLSTVPEDAPELPLSPTRLTNEKPELASLVPQTPRREGLNSNLRSTRTSRIKIFELNAVKRLNTTEIQRINDDECNSSSNSESENLVKKPKYQSKGIDGFVVFVNPDGDSDFEDESVEEPVENMRLGHRIPPNQLPFFHPPRSFAQEEMPKYNRRLEERPAFRPSEKKDSISINPAFTKLIGNKEKLKLIRPNLPPGIKVDANGSLSGAQITTHFPSAGSNVKYLGRKIETELQEQGKKNINSLNLPPKKANGVLVVNAAVGDLSRAYYEIPNFDGSPNLNAKAKDSGVVAQALFDFAGNENSALVLSNLLLQTIPIIFLSSMANGKGEDIAGYLRYVTKNQARVGKTTILDKNGVKQMIVTEGMGGTRFKISRDGNQFKVAVKLNAYLEHRADQNVLPIHQGGAIGVKFETEIYVDAGQAERKVLVLTMPNGIKSEWSGCLDLSLVN
jgi:hypothetical protein